MLFYGEERMLAELQPLIEMLDRAFDEAEKLLQDLNSAQLNWHPLESATRSEMTSSLYGLALHLSFVAIKGASRVLGQIPDLAAFPEAAQGNNGIDSPGDGADHALLALSAARTCVHATAEALTTSQLDELRERRIGNWLAEPKTVRWMMWHILEHTMLHIGHMELTRQLLPQNLA
jgi:hypothetical protein